MNAMNRILSIFLMVFTTQLVAQGKPELKLHIENDKVNMAASERTGNVEIIYSPGDTIKYTIIAENIGDGTMISPVVVDPIPSGVNYIANTAEGEDSHILFSINDGKNYMEWAPTYTIRDQNGKTIVKEATSDMVTHIKWEINKSLSPGENKKLAFKVVVK